MSGNVSLRIAAFVVAATVMVSHAADAHDDLHAQLKDLEYRIRALEGRSSIDLRRQLEIRALVTDVVADADSRASLLAARLQAGWDEGFFIASADRAHLLRIGILLQIRDVVNFRRGEDRTRYGFEHARTRLFLSGHVFDPALTYRVQGWFMRNGGELSLEDAFFRWAFADEWALTVGQFRIPLLREILVARSRQQLVERSLVHAEFTAGRSSGISLDHHTQRWQFSAALTDGTASTGGINSPALAPNVDYAVSGRAEHLVVGSWRQFEDFASRPGEEIGLMVGAAIHYQSGENAATYDGDILAWTIDASAEVGAANVFAYLAGRRLHDPVTGDRLNQFGAVVQGGIALSDAWGLFARYEWGDSDLDEPDLSVVTAGLTRFFARHRLKWTVDVGYGLRPIAPTWGGGMLGPGGNAAGWRTDNEGRRGQLVLRNQLQLTF